MNKVLKFPIMKIKDDEFNYKVTIAGDDFYFKNFNDAKNYLNKLKAYKEILNDI